MTSLPGLVEFAANSAISHHSRSKRVTFWVLSWMLNEFYYGSLVFAFITIFLICSIIVYATPIWILVVCQALSG